MNFNGLRYEFEATLADMESVVIQLPDTGPASVAVHPAGLGAGAQVDFTLSSLAKVKAGTANWLPAAIGNGAYPGFADAAAATDIPSPVSAIRVMAIMGSVVVEVLQ